MAGAEEKKFAESFLAIINRRGPFQEVLQLYDERMLSCPSFAAEKALEEVRKMRRYANDSTFFTLYLLCFLLMTERREAAASFLKQISAENILDTFLQLFSGNTRNFTNISLSGYNRQIFDAAIHALGVLNFENAEVSGEKNFLKNYLAGIPAPVVFDVGANRGTYSSLVKREKSDSSLYAFEPNPSSYRELKSVARSNKFVAVNVGLSDAEGALVLYDRSDIDGSSHASLYEHVISDIHKKEVVSVSVKVTTIDALMASLHLEKIDLLKIDTEGHEYAVLRGARAALSGNKIRAIHFEFNEMNVISRVFMKDFYDLLAGFEFFRMLPDGLLPLGAYRALTHELFAYQNIVAFNKNIA